ncbi:PTS sugar transporter subunit IIA [Candidatus Galacturonibacter soehngenii]|uniref:Ascorbate-specific PTS system EIIA component n=1 Tax=Candidatus Galacturonatibacter soehngenii TaxID=2307010 RepID=A0A7V7UAH1_9FIRM|nr:PTS sugar transporter subunit IIA [Candidatus Galacturonibacter soehngenii]KAB1435756.1 PTS sugar transporter subunit IIA [Candidatus Galacturonibacter soehngenii]MBA4686497.1 PTS sugar transporter subunit IIA [Candidatus Galacturonibacter soehngenii]
MLKEFVEMKHYKFAEEASDWREAIKMSCEVLEADGTVEANYKDDIIACVEKYGPYIVIIPEVAMPHSQENAIGVHKTAISFMKLNKPVQFDENDREKDARLFFTLASCNPEQHLNNMMRLSEMLSNEQVIEALLKAENEKDLLEIDNRYLKG